ncbi:SAM-dependent methyltransferase [Pseudoalteromonas luteoviolacea]|uniref:SAM-dependent methyltransferase n=1 Tax=Pseudoalteromonas luteoviolacea TaxID=43657 RepID=A0A1C0TRB7_9GAMM|nr:class I SAM-dependent methyltransferase [Pseudoalteromonas luteoviolacea]OCQ21484.1 SAM-dependent methyltransferase [Pseudoalteromonas luteoviolacea]
MPTFTGEEALNYDQRIGKLVPGYALLHQITAAQLSVTLAPDATILVVGAGTGREIIELAAQHRGWHFIAQDVSADMLEIADQNFTNLGIADRVTIHHGKVTDNLFTADAALCLLVMHFVQDNGDKDDLLAQISRNLKPEGRLYLADLMTPESGFEREAQFLFCHTALGLTEQGVEKMRRNFVEEFYPIGLERLNTLLDKAGFSTPLVYFKALGFSAFSSHKCI